MAPTGFLATVDYRPPSHPGLVAIDVVTPTCNRHDQLLEQAKRLGRQLMPQDRWIVVDDASRLGAADPRHLIEYLRPEQLLFVALSYVRQFPRETVNRARHAGASLARQDAWIVELDDHDWLEERALDQVRLAICRGATAIYGDTQLYWHGQPGTIERKPDYRPYLLRECNPTSGLRAYATWLYQAAGGYRFDGRPEMGGNEYPAGEYALFLRFEDLCEGQGLFRIPQVLCRRPLVEDGISMVEADRLPEVEDRWRAAYYSAAAR